MGLCVVLTEQGGGGEQSMSNDTSLTQPTSQAGYQGYPQQDAYQQWTQPQPQPQPTEGGGMPAPPNAAPKPTESPAPQQQRTPEEEAYWAEMSNKKVRSGENGNV